MVPYTATKIFSLEQESESSQLPWNSHPTCEGVALKHLITGELTDGRLSCHLVKIDAGCEISEHVHAGQLELHEVLSGEGTGSLPGREIPYATGATVVIPADTAHKVLAGENTLYLLAKFTPALL